MPNPVHYLRFSREEVTAGAVSAPITVLRYNVSGNRPRETALGPAIMTEDRHIRIYNENGEVVRTGRTGLRRATGVVQDRSGFIYAADPSGRVVRLSPDRGTSRTLLPGQNESVKIWNDPVGNLYVLRASGEILHISAAGSLLWRRSLTARIAATASNSTFLFVATTDGRVYHFDSSGSGGVVFRTEQALTQLRVGVIERSLSLVGGDENGNIVRIVLDSGDGGSGNLGGDLGGRRSWLAPMARGAELIDVDAQGNVWVIESDGTIIVLDSQGTRRGSVRINDLAVERTALNPIRNRLYLVDEENRLLTILPDGHIDGSLQLASTPASIHYLPAIDELVILYDDWRLEVYTGPGPPSGLKIQELNRREALRPARASVSALRSLGDTVLQGSSEAERHRLLGVLHTRLVDAQLFGDVAHARTIAVGLLTETDNLPRNDYPEVRMRAVAFLGRILDTPSRSALSSAVRGDPDIRVASHALKMLALHALDDSHVLDHGLQRWMRSRSQERDMIAEAIISFVEALVGVGGHYAPADVPIMLRVARELAANVVSQEYRSRALRVLSILSD